MKLRITAVLAIVLTIFIQTLPSFAANQENPSGTVYYVDSKKGSDYFSGTSAAKAWKSLKKVNSTVFRPGDKILF